MLRNQLVETTMPGVKGTRAAFPRMETKGAPHVLTRRGGRVIDFKRINKSIVRLPSLLTALSR